MSYFNEDQEAYMQSLSRVPREEKCVSGWHVLKNDPNCGCKERETIQHHYDHYQRLAKLGILDDEDREQWIQAERNI